MSEMKTNDSETTGTLNMAAIFVVLFSSTRFQNESLKNTDFVCDASDWHSSDQNGRISGGDKLYLNFEEIKAK